MRAHVIEDGTITNTIEVENLDFLPNLIDASIGGGIGWSYANGELTPPLPPPEPVPDSVSMRQARRQLDKLGAYGAVNAAVATMSTAAQIDWEFAGTVDRNDALATEMIVMLGWSESDADTYFIEAAKL